MNTMNHKGYAARIEFDPEDGIFVGHVAGMRDSVSFHGCTVEQLKQAFAEAVEDYRAACRKLEQSPERPASGKILLRLPPELHAAPVRAVELSGTSLNQWAAKTLRDAS